MQTRLITNELSALQPRRGGSQRLPRAGCGPVAARPGRCLVLGPSFPRCSLLVLQIYHSGEERYLPGQLVI